MNYCRFQHAGKKASRFAEILIFLENHEIPQKSGNFTKLRKVPEILCFCKIHRFGGLPAVTLCSYPYRAKAFIPPDPVQS